MSRCIGCGAIIQSNNPEQLGYVAEAILIERGKDVYCKRCYEIMSPNFIELFTINNFFPFN